MPISGEITEVNKGLDTAPENVNSDPYGEGWMVKLKFSNAAELDGLLCCFRIPRPYWQIRVLPVNIQKPCFAQGEQGFLMICKGSGHLSAGLFYGRWSL